MLINSRSHIKFNSPMFFFHFIIWLPIFSFFHVCNKMCIFILGHSEFSFSFNLLFYNIGNTYIMSKLYTFDISFTSHIFLSHIKRSFYNIDKLDVCSGGGSFISNVTSTYFNFRFDITLITVRTFKVWCYNWLITFVHNLLSFFPSILAADY